MDNDCFYNLALAILLPKNLDLSSQAEASL